MEGFTLTSLKSQPHFRSAVVGLSVSLHTFHCIAILHTLSTMDKYLLLLQPPDKAMYLKKIAVINKVDPYVLPVGLFSANPDLQIKQVFPIFKLNGPEFCFTDHAKTMKTGCSCRPRWRSQSAVT
ncbi:hypothetical protein ATANTOWER_006664 [Ataeniobius toweri]|uniref:Uncharacterized protein n=1 Tax=Ataeniobius toweri TaxID=208326 RepID=A0ABU7AMK3_9TELE|nr:hypothetical protein [Ataeniobius toweri]